MWAQLDCSEKSIFSYFEGEPQLNEHPALTFPDKDLSIGAVVQNEAVARLQSTLGERVLCCHQCDGHASTGIGHLYRKGV